MKMNDLDSKPDLTEHSELPLDLNLSKVPGKETAWTSGVQGKVR